MIDISGTYTFNAAPERVWDLLMDPEAISSCITGVERFEPDGADRYRVTMTAGLAAITGRYEGTVLISEKSQPSSYRLTIEAQGRTGFVKGDAQVALKADGDARTIVDVKGAGAIGGAIARVGQRLAGSVAKMMMDRFFACLQSKLKL